MLKKFKFLSIFLNTIKKFDKLVFFAIKLLKENF